ncbi:MAG: hypothetical protein EPN22_08540 [Nitrospirae bacterium]|nr:MAG: hypothetical protein EPN22_08540 [Nitrospirota bacterium]
MSESLKIIEEKNIFDDNFLDVTGNEFRFSHEKGLSEWLKNSADAYLRAERDDEDSFIVFRFRDKDTVVFECIDFIGMASEDIDKALKRWGDPEAAKRGTGKRVFGGHGNGGKFYMRQMFKQSHFITYRLGKLNVFGFNENRRYGFADGFKDKNVTPEEAMKFAEIDDMDFPPTIRKNILNGNFGFTVARGGHPDKIVRKKFNLHKLCDRFKNYPQARIILKYKPVSIVYNDKTVISRLFPEEISPLLEFQTPLEIPIPLTLVWNDDGDKETISFANDKFPAGKLVLYTSNEPLSRNSRLGDLNRIDIIGEIGVIASYHMQELGYINRLSSAEFIYGECKCPLLEDQDDDCVKNDRSTLVENHKTKTLRKWIGEQIDKLAEKIEEKEKKEIRAKNIEMLSEINKILNDWKNKFMSRVMREILGGGGEGIGAGFGTGGSSGGAGGERNKRKNGDIGSGEGKRQGGGSSEFKPKQTFPKVLLSGIDEDPLDPAGNKLELLDRQEPVYQRPQDVPVGIYWINTSRKLAQYIIDKHGVKSMKWRDYHLQRIIDVICKEALYKLEKQDPENFNAARVDGEIINKLVGKAHDSAVESLGGYIFEEDYKTPREELLEKISGLRNLDSEEQKILLREIEDAIAFVKGKGE